MPVISVSFVLLLVGVFAAYYLLPQPHRWMALLAASLLFYWTAGVSSLAFMLVTSVSVYASACWMQRIADGQKALFKAQALSREEKAAIRKQNQRRRKAILIGTLVLNVGLLCFFKYAPALLRQLGILVRQVSGKKLGVSLRLIAPLGISFYTFQSVGYLVDVYGGSCRAQTSYPRLLLFVSFFPQITQGPINAYEELSQTLYAGHGAQEKGLFWGFQRMLWGFMKKMVIANTLAQSTSVLFGGYRGYAGIAILLGAFLYLIQLYADFSGYMDIMCGFCEMLGIRLAENFSRPFFSKSISEYWRRWHITLGRWFRKYVYYPIGVASWNLRLAKACRGVLGKHAASCLPPTVALVITWFCTGLWHGASWGYIVWGLLNGLFIILSLWLAPVYERTRRALRIREDSRFWRSFRVLRTFTLVALLEVLPEVGKKLSDGFRFWACIVTNWRMPHSLAELLPFVHLRNFNKAVGFGVAMGCVLLLLILSLVQRKRPVRAVFNALPVGVQVVALAALLLLIGSFGVQASWGAEGFMYANF